MCKNCHSGMNWLMLPICGKCSHRSHNFVHVIIVWTTSNPRFEFKAIIRVWTFWGLRSTFLSPKGDYLHSFPLLAIDCKFSMAPHTINYPICKEIKPCDRCIEWLNFFAELVCVSRTALSLQIGSFVFFFFFKTIGKFCWKSRWSFIHCCTLHALPVMW